MVKSSRCEAWPVLAAVFGRAPGNGCNAQAPTCLCALAGSGEAFRLPARGEACFRASWHFRINFLPDE